ncbi:hypothetical protein [Methylobacter svalbardensis]|uniref:hypothetical protein n=1 Tax=Methylobacter svalbardensis TaxID=3080016 RepID=UPI0030EE2D35
MTNFKITFNPESMNLILPLLAGGGADGAFEKFPHMHRHKKIVSLYDLTQRHT